MSMLSVFREAYLLHMRISSDLLLYSQFGQISSVCTEIKCRQEIKIVLCACFILSHHCKSRK